MTTLKRSPVGIAILSYTYYRVPMKTLTVKMPDSLLAWLESEARRANRPKSAIVRDALLRQQQQQGRSALDLAKDLCGSVDSGLGDLSHNKKHLQGFGR